MTAAEALEFYDRQAQAFQKVERVLGRMEGKLRSVSTALTNAAAQLRALASALSGAAASSPAPAAAKAAESSTAASDLVKEAFGEMKKPREVKQDGTPGELPIAMFLKEKALPELVFDIALEEFGGDFEQILQPAVEVLRSAMGVIRSLAAPLAPVLVIVSRGLELLAAGLDKVATWGPILAPIALSAAAAFGLLKLSLRSAAAEQTRLNLVTKLWGVISKASTPVLIVAGLALVIGAVYALTALVNKLTGSTVSATGLICGAFLMVGAIILNTAIGVLNAIIQAVWGIFVEPGLALIEFLINAVNGGFNGVLGLFQNLAGQIIGIFLGLGKVVSKIIDAIFGTELTTKLEDMQSKVRDWGKSENAVELDMNAPEIEKRFTYQGAWDTGYAFGEGLGDKLSSLTAPGEDLTESAATTADNTGRIADGVEMAEEDLDFLRSAAELRYIQNFVTLTPTVAMRATVRQEADVDSVARAIERKLEEEFTASAEGVYV